MFLLISIRRYKITQDSVTIQMACQLEGGREPAPLNHLTSRFNCTLTLPMLNDFHVPVITSLTPLGNKLRYARDVKIS